MFLRGACIKLWGTFALVAALMCSGCGGSRILGRLPMPPQLAAEERAAVVEGLEFPGTASAGFERPVAVRVYPSGEVIVDVAVVSSAVEPRYAEDAGRAYSQEELVRWAAYMTNGLSVPAVFNSSGKEGDRIVIHDAEGARIVCTRVVEKHAFAEPDLHTTFSEKGMRAGVLRRAGLPWAVTIMPILVTTDRPVKVGDEVDVQIERWSGSRRRVDGRAYRMRVREFRAPGVLEIENHRDEDISVAR